MPFTFLSHQAAVLPLKLARPGLDGVALVVGSLTPDLAYALNGTPAQVNAHGLAQQLWFCLPVTVALAWVVRHVVARPLATALPSGGWFCWDDYRVVARRRPAVWVTALSALLGSGSHVAWDSLTHRDRWGTDHISWLREPLLTVAGREVPGYQAAQYVGSLLGAAVTLWLLREIARRRLLLRWHPEAVSAGADLRPGRWFWVWPGVGAAVAAVLLVIQRPGAAVAVNRSAVLVAVGVVASCLLARRRARPLS